MAKTREQIAADIKAEDKRKGRQQPPTIKGSLKAGLKSVAGSLKNITKADEGSTVSKIRRKNASTKDEIARQTK